MDLSKLYNVLVAGGSALAMSCGTTTSEQPKPKPGPEAFDAKKCSSICQASGGAIICPDPVMKVQNCCWLMSPPDQHPCCDVDPNTFPAE